MQRQKEKKEDTIGLKNNLYKPQQFRRSGNDASLSGSTTRGSADNLAGSDSEMSRLRRPENRGSSDIDITRSMTKRAEHRILILSQSMTGLPATRRVDGDVDVASLMEMVAAIITYVGLLEEAQWQMGRNIYLLTTRMIGLFEDRQGRRQQAPTIQIFVHQAGVIWVDQGVLVGKASPRP